MFCIVLFCFVSLYLILLKTPCGRRPPHFPYGVCWQAGRRQILGRFWDAFGHFCAFLGSRNGKISATIVDISPEDREIGPRKREIGPRGRFRTILGEKREKSFSISLLKLGPQSHPKRAEKRLENRTFFGIVFGTVVYDFGGKNPGEITRNNSKTRSGNENADFSKFVFPCTREYVF